MAPLSHPQRTVPKKFTQKVNPPLVRRVRNRLSSKSIRMANVNQNPIAITAYQFKGNKLFVWYNMLGEEVDHPALLSAEAFWTYTHARLQSEGPVPAELLGYLQAAPAKEYVFAHIADYMLQAMQAAAVEQYERDLAQLAWLEGKDTGRYIPEDATLYLRNYSRY